MRAGTNTVTSDIDRRKLLHRLFKDSDKWVFISGLAGASKDTAALTNDGANLFSMAGTMGAAVPMGLGVALSAPNENVAVITGDGEMLMGIGALATVAAMKPQNLRIVCLDNSMHGETGGQTGLTAQTTNLELIARGAGIERTMTVTQMSQVAEAETFLKQSRGPVFLLCRITPTEPSNYKRNMKPDECRTKFQRGFLEKSGF
tara:strand:+ start:2479 stop:3087 length:609 start_codon:yes stop_codon:yes gene_type:complete